jgi:hypothetical protein
MRKYIILLLFIASLFSCEDDLQQTPISAISVPGFFSNETEFIQAVNATYEPLSEYPIWHFNLFDVRSDNIYGVTPDGLREHEFINNFVTNLSGNEYIVDAYNVNFRGIMRANTVLDNISSTSVEFTNEEMKLRLEAEAKFLRAFYYFDLVQIFGKVPIIDKVTNAEDALNIPRSPVSDVYTLIISDLKYAIDHLDDFYAKDDENRGRATKDAAKGLLARVYLTRSGTDYGIEGPGLNSNEYNEALSLLNDIISNASGKYELVDDYASIFAVSNEDNPEIIWDIQLQSGGLGVGSNYPGEMVGAGWGTHLGITFSIGIENRDVSDYLMSAFDTINDERYSASIAKTRYVIGNSDGDDEIDTTAVYDPACIKFISSDPSEWGQDRNDFPNNYPILRYADILLMKAECILNGASGSQSEVNIIINDIRTRAGLDPITGDATIDDLLDERQKEFLGEGQRWGDLVRSGKVLEVINSWIPVEDVSKNMRQNFPIEEFQIIFPIPFKQIEVKDGLYEQNPGYV